MKFRTELKGERIFLRKTELDRKFASRLFGLIDSNRDSLRPWLPWEKFTRSVDDSYNYLLGNEKKFESSEKIEYGIWVGDDYVGNIAIFDIEEKHKSGEVGYWISKEFAGKGYMTEALRVLDKEAFENLGFNRIFIKCDEENLASARIPQKCGYVFEGKHREETFNEHFGNFRNKLYFSKLKSDYFNGR